MSHRQALFASVIAVSLGFGGTALAQQANPDPARPSGNAPATDGQQVNPSPMPPGSRAGDAPGMGGAANRAPGAQAQQLNPSPMPPGSRAGDAPGMSPGPQAQGSAADRGVIGGTGAQAPSAQPDVDRGTAPGTTLGTTTGAASPTGSADGGGRLVPGSNSFTEGQARSRMSDAGFNDVQDLRLDEQGIWRGRGIRNGQQTGVALDYQGNVVPTR